MLRKGLIAVLLLLMLGLGMAQAHGEGEIHLHDVWSKPNLDDDGDEPSVVYLTIHNAGAHPIALTAVETPISVAPEFQNNGAAVANILIEPDEHLTFSDEGYRIVLNNVNHPQAEGDAFTLLLKFDMLNDDGTTRADPLYAVTAALVTTEPVASDIVLVNAWARPTVAPLAGGFGMGLMNHEAMGGMNHGQMGEATAEAPMGGMNHGQMGEATAEAPMGGMNHGQMGGSMGVSAIYMMIENVGATAAQLVAVSVPVAGVAQIHESKMVDNVMKMEEVAGGLELLPGATVSLQQGGLHMMLMDLNTPLEQGAAFVATLTFADGRTQLVAVPVFDLTLLMMGR
jgi:copper(I)-binding protein